MICDDLHRGCLSTVCAYPVRERPGDVFEVVVVEEVGGVERHPFADPADDGRADVRVHISKARAEDALPDGGDAGLQGARLAVAGVQGALEAGDALLDTSAHLREPRNFGKAFTSLLLRRKTDA